MRSQFGKIIRESDVCVLCGKEKATTREHIPPRSLFVTRPSEYLAVPACEQCNNSTKLDDEHLREVMSATSLVGAGRKVWKKKVVPKIKTLPATRARFQKGTYLSDVKVPKTNFRLPGLKIDAPRIDVSIRKMVFGLYWFHTGALLSPATKLEVGFLNVVQLPKYFEDPNNQEILSHTQHGIYRQPEVLETFSYRFGVGEGTSLWYIFFYKQNAFIVIATEPE